MMIIRNRLKELRELRGMTQIELSTKSGVYTQQISRMENHRSDFIDLRKLPKLMGALGVADFNDMFEFIEQ